jgi:hypothetical protein
MPENVIRLHQCHDHLTRRQPSLFGRGSTAYLSLRESRSPRHGEALAYQEPSSASGNKADRTRGSVVRRSITAPGDTLVVREIGAPQRPYVPSRKRRLARCGIEGAAFTVGVSSGTMVAHFARDAAAPSSRIGFDITPATPLSQGRASDGARCAGTWRARDGRSAEACDARHMCMRLACRAARHR